jgi:TldD protein
MIPQDILFRTLRKSLRNGGEFTDIIIEESIGTHLICEEDRIDQVVMGREQGAGLRVIHKLHTLYAHTNDLGQTALHELATTLGSAVLNGPDRSMNIPRYENRGASHPSPPGSLYETVTTKKRQAVLAANRFVRRLDPRVRQVKVIYRDGCRRIIIANSEGQYVDEVRIGTVFAVQVVAGKDGFIQTGYEAIGGSGGFELFDHDLPECVAERAARRAFAMLEAVTAPVGPMPVILSAEAGGTMIHEAVGHGLEADLAGEGFSVYSGKLGERIASPLITVLDDATLPGKRGSFRFDDEGVPAQRTVLVEQGVLVSYMYDRLTAMKAKTRSTGNGRRESFRHKPIPRMTNTMICPGDHDPAEILRSVPRALLVKKMGGGQVNTVNGDFVFEVTEGYLVEHGEIGPPVRGANLIGNGPRILQTIDMVGNDLGFAIGTCGKEGQGVPVSDAQPTLRIPEITVGGQGR